jgi:hypothetical protein
MDSREVRGCNSQVISAKARATAEDPILSPRVGGNQIPAGKKIEPEGTLSNCYKGKRLQEGFHNRG